MTITVIILLSIITITEILKYFKPRYHTRYPIFYVLPITGEIENIEEILRTVKSEADWNDTASAKKIVLLNINARQETINICKKFCEDNPLFTLMTKEELTTQF